MIMQPKEDSPLLPCDLCLNNLNQGSRLKHATTILMYVVVCIFFF